MDDLVPLAIQALELGERVLIDDRRFPSPPIDLTLRELGAFGSLLEKVNQ
jgi:hypothetical protein